MSDLNDMENKNTESGNGGTDIDTDTENAGMTETSVETSVETPIEALGAKPDGNQPEQAQEPAKSAVGQIFEMVELVVLSVVYVMLILTFIGRHSPVIGSSMVGTLHENDVLIISDMFYTPKNGDIVVFESQTTGYDKPYVKRVIATEGQTVDIDFVNWRVTVDGKVVDEPYITRVAGSMYSSHRVSFPFTVSKGCVFVMGDNRNYSTDSRDIGEVDARCIIGRVVFRVYPFNKIGTVS